MFHIKLLLNLVLPLFSLCFFLFISLMMILTVIESINEGNFFDSIWLIVLLFVFIFHTLKEYRATVKTYKDFVKNHFLDTYLFPKELSKILREKYPHLKKSEVVEVLESMKEFYRLQINKETTICLNETIAVFLSEQDEEQINPKIFEIWRYCCKKEKIDPFSPHSFPSFFTLDKRLKIPSGFIYELDKFQFEEIDSILKAPNLDSLKDKIKNVEKIDYLAKKIQDYLGSYIYCQQYQREELAQLFKLIDKNQPLAHAVYGQYSDVDLFKKTVLDNSAPPPKDIGCSCGASI